MSDRDNAVRLALLKVLAELLGEKKATADCAVRDEWKPKDRMTATLPDGTDIGTVTLTSGAKKAKLADEAAFEDWVKATHPEALITVTKTYVEPGFQARLLAAAKKLGEPVDAETGEIVPGIEIAQGDPYPMVKLADGAREAVAAAWQSGELTELLSGLLAIEGGE